MGSAQKRLENLRSNFKGDKTAGNQSRPTDRKNLERVYSMQNILKARAAEEERKKRLNDREGERRNYRERESHSLDRGRAWNNTRDDSAWSSGAPSRQSRPLERGYGPSGAASDVSTPISRSGNTGGYVTRNSASDAGIHPYRSGNTGGYLASSAASDAGIHLYRSGNVAQRSAMPENRSYSPDRQADNNFRASNAPLRSRVNELPEMQQNFARRLNLLDAEPTGQNKFSFEEVLSGQARTDQLLLRLVTEIEAVHLKLDTIAHDQKIQRNRSEAVMHEQRKQRAMLEEIMRQLDSESRFDDY